MFGRKIADRRNRKGRGRLGQVVVEMLLILPVFLTIIFAIMEMGHMAFCIIVLNHATYEVARIGALRATALDGGEPQNVDALMNTMMRRIIAKGTVTSFSQATKHDNQAGIMNHDLVVTGRYDVLLLFPISRIMMSSPLLCPQGPGEGECMISATVRMPIERPLQR